MKLSPQTKDILYYLLTASLIFIGIFVAVSSSNLPAGIQMFSVQTGSMAPSIPTGSFIVTRPVSQYHPGDVITFKSDGVSSSVTHRIVKIQSSSLGDLYLTKGDANFVVDTQPASPSAVIGKVVVSLPLLGYLVDFFKTKTGIVFLTIPGTLIVYTELRKIKNQLTSSG